MQFGLLGQLEVRDGQREIPLASGKRRALLTLLLLYRNEVVTAERLIDELWSGRPPPTAAKGLQVQISQLRKDLASATAVNGTAVLTRGGGYVLEVAPGDVDVDRFEAALADAEDALAAGRPRPAAARLREGLALWRGPPLADVRYEEFAQPEIARLEELRLTATERRIDADLALGRHRELVAELEALVREHPLNERFRGQLMLSLYQGGRTGDALEVYREGRARTVDELGLEPGDELRRLEAQILAGSAELRPPPRRSAAAQRSAGRAGVVLVAAGVLLAGAALAALLIDRGRGSGRPAAAAADVAPNSVLALDADGRRAAWSVPLPGRPTDLAARGDQLFAVSVDSSALTVVDARTRTITRTVPLGLRPAAVAAGAGGVWVVDGRRGVLARLDAGYERVALRVTWRRTAPPAPAGPSRHDPTGAAVAGGRVWVTDGSAALLRADARGRRSRVPAPHPLDGVTAGAGAVWAFSTRAATVVRVDPRTGRITNTIPIVGRPGGEAPAPIAIAATRDAVWVLNGNTATVTRIDAHDRGLVVGTTPIGVERGPRDIEAGAGAVWVANFDGSVTRIPAGGGAPREIDLGGALSKVAAGPARVWLGSTALDQQLPGGAG
jgi:YVTN family beta-propeller protein